MGWLVGLLVAPASRPRLTNAAHLVCNAEVSSTPALINISEVLVLRSSLLNRFFFFLVSFKEFSSM